MRLIKYSLTVVMIALWLSGCQLTTSSNQNADGSQLITNDENSNGEDNGAFSPPPKLSQYRDWNTIFPKLVDKIVSFSDTYESNHVILISDVQNRSDDYIAMSQIKDILRNTMMQQAVFTVVDQNAVNDAKQKLGISYDDQLVSRGKMVALARYLDSDYVLFTTIYSAPDENNDARVSMELLYTKTGEILKRVTTAQLIAEEQADDQNKPAPLSPLQPTPATQAPTQIVPWIDNSGNLNGASQ